MSKYRTMRQGCVHQAKWSGSHSTYKQLGNYDQPCYNSMAAKNFGISPHFPRCYSDTAQTAPAHLLLTWPTSFTNTVKRTAFFIIAKLLRRYWSISPSVTTHNIPYNGMHAAKSHPLVLIACIAKQQSSLLAHSEDHVVWHPTIQAVCTKGAFPSASCHSHGKVSNRLMKAASYFCCFTSLCACPACKPASHGCLLQHLASFLLPSKMLQSTSHTWLLQSGMH
jgi:hypothetical protein